MRTTPGIAAAFLLAIFTIRACACGERTYATCSMRGQHDVVDVLPAALGESPRVRARHRAPDVAVRRVEGQRLRRFVEFAHSPLLPARALATASIASTIAW